MDAPAFPAGVLAAARDAAKAHLRILGSDEDAVIAGFAASAMALCEAFTGQALIAREFAGMLAASPRWQALAVVPVAAIAVAGVPAEAVAIDVDAGGTGWVRVTAPGAARVAVTYTAGIAATWDQVPAPLAQGVVLLVAHLFGGRDGASAPPAAVSALWRPWRRLRLRPERAA